MPTAAIPLITAGAGLVGNLLGGGHKGGGQQQTQPGMPPQPGFQNILSPMQAPFAGQGNVSLQAPTSQPGQIPGGNIDWLQLYHQIMGGQGPQL